MWLRKASGGTTLTHGGKHYTWAGDGDVVQVPAGFGGELLAIRGGGFSQAEAPPKPAPAVKPAAPPTVPAPAVAAPKGDVKTGTEGK